MQGLLSSARGYAGTTLLGDGKVLLVLDIKEILR
jgi:two-component system chemotaxis sensor kinase CheA